MDKSSLLEGFIKLTNQETIYYQQIGNQYLRQRPSLLLVHGNFSNTQWWHTTIQHLEHQHYHIIAIDQRGFGKSSYHHPCHRFNDWALDLKQFCKLRGIQKCIVNGWSFGGGVSMKLAQIAPQLVHKLILTCSVSNEGLCMKTKGIKCKSRKQILENNGIKFMSTILQTKNAAKLAEIYEIAAFSHMQDSSKQLKQILLRGAFQQRCYIDVMGALANSDIDVSKIKAKCLMVHGKQDPVVVWDSVKHMQPFFTQFVVWDSYGHMLPIERSQQYQELILSFMQE